MNIVRIGTVVVIGAVALTSCACKKNSESTDRKETTRIEAGSQPGVSGNYVTPDYEMRGEGYDWVAVSVKQLSADVIWLSVRSRADRKKPTCTFDTKAYRTNDSTFSTVAEGKTVIIKFGAESVTIATERPEDEAALYFFCSGGATVAGTYKKMDGPLDVTQVDKTTFSKILRLQGIGFHVTSKPKAGKEELEIYPFGLSVDNRSITQLIDGSVADAEIEDLNSDGFPEVVVYTQSGENKKGSVVGCSVNNGKSMSSVHFPSVAENEKIGSGYNGYDEFSVVETYLSQRFPIFENGKETGRMRQITYKLVEGEASRRFVVANINEYDKN